MYNYNLLPCHYSRRAESSPVKIADLKFTYQNKAGRRDLPDEFLYSTEDTKRSFGAFWWSNIGWGLTWLRSSLAEDGWDLSETCHIEHLIWGEWWQTNERIKRSTADWCIETRPSIEFQLIGVLSIINRISSNRILMLMISRDTPIYSTSSYIKQNLGFYHEEMLNDGRVHGDIAMSNPYGVASIAIYFKGMFSCRVL